MSTDKEVIEKYIADETKYMQQVDDFMKAHENNQMILEQIFAKVFHGFWLKAEAKYSLNDAVFRVLLIEEHARLVKAQTRLAKECTWLDEKILSFLIKDVPRAQFDDTLFLRWIADVPQSQHTDDEIREFRIERNYRGLYTSENLQSHMVYITDDFCRSHVSLQISIERRQKQLLRSIEEIFDFVHYSLSRGHCSDEYIRRRITDKSFYFAIDNITNIRCTKLELHNRNSFRSLLPRHECTYSYVIRISDFYKNIIAKNMLYGRIVDDLRAVFILQSQQVRQVLHVLQVRHVYRTEKE